MNEMGQNLDVVEQGLDQLTTPQLRRILAYKGEMLLSGFVWNQEKGIG